MDLSEGDYRLHRLRKERSSSGLEHLVYLSQKFFCFGVVH